MSRELIEEYDTKVAKLFKEYPEARGEMFNIVGNTVSIRLHKEDIEQLSMHLNYSLLHDTGDVYTHTTCRVRSIYWIVGLINYINDTMHGRYDKPCSPISEMRGIDWTKIFKEGGYE